MATQRSFKRRWFVTALNSGTHNDLIRPFRTRARAQAWVRKHVLRWGDKSPYAQPTDYEIKRWWVPARSGKCRMCHTKLEPTLV